MPKSSFTSTNVKINKPTVKKLKRPEIRCPFCSKNTQLPAEICAHCQTDFRTGSRKPRFGIFSIISKKIMPFVIMISFLGAAVSFAAWLNKNYFANYKFEQTNPLTTMSNQEDHNMLSPYVAVQKAVLAINDLNASLYQRQEIIRELFPGDENAFESAKNLSLEEREKLLKELSIIIDKNEKTAGADYKSTTPAQRQQMLDELDKTK